MNHNDPRDIYKYAQEHRQRRLDALLKRLTDKKLKLVGDARYEKDELITDLKAIRDSEEVE